MVNAYYALNLRGRMSDRKKRQVFEDSNRCPECGGAVVTDDDKGERMCEACGLVVSQGMIDFGQEYRLFDEDAKGKERTGAPPSEVLADKGVATHIDRSMKDHAGNQLSPSARREASRLRKWQYKTRANSSQSRNMSVALAEIKRRAAQMQLPASIRDETAHLYRRSVNENLIRGRSMRAVIAACMYLACRMCSHSITVDDIAKALSVSRKETGRIYRYLRMRFGIHLQQQSGDLFVERCCQQLKLPEATMRKARQYVMACEDAGLDSGKSPLSLVAASIYIACGKKDGGITQEDISEVCNVTEVTLRNRVKDVESIIKKSLANT